MLNPLISHPKKLFLIDGIGAIVSAFLLGVILVKFEAIFGIPRSTLYFLAVLPCLFSVYDFCCYFIVDKNVDQFLKGIAFTNLLYCVLSISLALYHREFITVFGWAYILTEIAIVSSLAFIEHHVANKLKK